MDGQHRSPARVRHGLSWLIALTGVAALLALLLGPAAAGAATTDDAQLSLTGVVDSNNPAGGSQIGIRPGNSVSFTASAAPTAKVKSLVGSIGLGGVLNSLLGAASFQVTADFSHLPGGHSGTVLSGSKTARFAFSHTGTYSFTYQAQKVTAGLLATSIAPINLNGNQAKQAGVELNSSNQYVGKVVVSKNPSNGISIQLPSVQIHPKVAGRQLPKINIPGVNVPTVKVPVPNLNLPKKSSSPAKPGSSAKTRNAGVGHAATGSQPADGLLPVPARVVPGGFGSAQYGGSGGGYYAAALPGTNTSGSGYAPLTLNGHSGTSNSGPAATSGSDTGTKTVDLAADKTASAQLPVVLAILAIIALALVASTYARLFLLKRNA